MNTRRRNGPKIGLIYAIELIKKNKKREENIIAYIGREDIGSENCRIVWKIVIVLLRGGSISITYLLGMILFLGIGSMIAVRFGKEQWTAIAVLIQSTIQYYQRDQDKKRESTSIS